MPLAELVLPVLLGPVVEDLYTEGSATIRQALEREPLRRPLRSALEQAEQGFHQSLEVSGFTLDAQARADLDEMFRDEGVLRAVGELPFRPIGAIDTARCRELFSAMGPSGAEAADFDAAWQAMGRRFQKAAARSEELRSLLELARLDAVAEHQQLSAERLAKIEEILTAILERIEAGGPVQDEALAEYREWFYESYRYVDTRGLFMREKERPGEGIELRDVFVETLLAPADRERREGKGRESESDADRDPRRRLASELEGLDGPESDLGNPTPGTPGDAELPGLPEPPAEPRRIAEVLTRAESAAPGVPIVILGPPGSGKSTLMRCLGMAICNPEARPDLLDPGGSGDRVPILCELKRFASRLASTPDQRLLPYLVEQLGESLPAVEDLLRRGEALVLLDGLDEVFDDHHRRWVSEQVWELVTRFRQTRFVLTSRPYGYHAAPLPGRTDRWDLRPFGDDGIRSFFRGWFAALEREGIDPGVRGDGREKADGLTEDVLSRPRIREMAENPMLCTLIVLVQRSRTGPLPQRRIEFYDAAVRTLAERWEQAKHRPKQEKKYDFPEPELILKALAEVAWRAFHELERREIPEATLRAWLRAVLADHPDWAGPRGRRAIDDLLEVVRDRTGLLVEAGGDRYQFVHLSLHEYLASQFILDRLDQERGTRVLLHHLHTPEWDEVLRLTVAGAGQARAEHFLRAVLTRLQDRTGDPTEIEIERQIETRLHRDLRFLGRCLGDGVVVAPDLRGEIQDRLAAAIRDPRTEKVHALAEDWAAVGLSPRLATRLWEWATDAKGEAHRAVARLAPDVEEVRATLLPSLADEDFDVRGSAVEYFTRIGADDSDVRAAVLQRLDDENPFVRDSAVKYFMGIGAVDSEVRANSLERLDDEDDLVRTIAVVYLTRIGADDPEVRAAVLERIDDEDDFVRGSAMEYFTRIGADDPEVRAAVLERIDDEDDIVRGRAVKHLTRIGADDAQVRAAFLERLDDEDDSVRDGAMEYFAQIGADDSEVRAAFLERLDNENPVVRDSAVEYFMGIGAADSEVRAAVLERLHDENRSVRASAVEYFTGIGADDAQVRAAVLERLDDEDDSVRDGAIEYFAQIGADDAQVRAAVLERLGDEDDIVRRSAVAYFTRIGAGDVGAHDAFVERLDDENPLLRASAVEYFTRTGAEDEAVRARITELLSDPAPAVRIEVLEYLVDREAQGLRLDEMLDAFAAVSGRTSARLDREVARTCGRLAAGDPSAFAVLLERGSEIWNFPLGDALEACAAERDRLAHERAPLEIRVR